MGAKSMSCRALSLEHAKEILQIRATTRLEFQGLNKMKFTSPSVKILKGSSGKVMTLVLPALLPLLLRTLS